MGSGPLQDGSRAPPPPLLEGWCGGLGLDFVHKDNCEGKGQGATDPPAALPPAPPPPRMVPTAQEAS